VKNVLDKFEKTNSTLIVHNAEIVDENLKPIYPDSTFKWRNSGKGIMKNIIKNSYIGCCIAFDSSLKKYILPIPNNIEMHDQWIGIISEKYGKNCFIEDELIKYRRHNDNASEMKHYKMKRMIKNRVNFLEEYCKRKREIKKSECAI